MLTSNRWLIIVAVMLAAVIEVLDMTIVNVALPQMMGALSADFDQITWVLTSYIVSSAIVMLLTGFLATRLGRRQLLLINIVGFMIFSCLCGLAFNLPQIVLFRTLQGVFGASLVPLSQFILRDTFSKEEQGMAMAIWGVGIMVAPVLGPSLGGYITAHLSWRWIFFINIPICLISLFMTLRVIPETPRTRLPVDWAGLLLLAAGIGSLQLFLDRGNTEDWLNSNQIKIFLLVAIVSLTVFIIRNFSQSENNIIDLRIFRDRGFAIATLMFTVFGIGLFGSLAIQPLMLENLMNYPVITTGNLMAPRGIASAIMMFIVGYLMAKKVDARIFIGAGILISAYGSWLMSGFNMQVDYNGMLWSMIIQGIGMGLFFVPLSAIAMNTLPAHQIGGATGLFSFGRNLGSSIGISLLGTLFTRSNQINWNTMGSHIQVTNPRLWLWLQQNHYNINDPVTIQILGKQLGEQIQMQSFINIYWFVAMSFLIMLPLVITLRTGNLRGGMVAH